MGASYRLLSTIRCSWPLHLVALLSALLLSLITTLDVQAASADSTEAGTTVKIEGGELFVRRTKWALGWIDKAGMGDFVNSNLELIKENPELPYLGAMGLTADGKPAAVFKSAPSDLWWYASAIVHEAAHARDYKAGRKYWGPEGEHAADIEQQRLLDALGSSLKVIRDPATIPDTLPPLIDVLQTIVIN
ncbi:MAG: hypothetical protein ACOX87_13740 [Chloroflexota bacterium]